MGVGSSARKIVVEFLGKDTGAGKTASDLEKKFGTLGKRMNKVGVVAGRTLAAGLVFAGAAAIKAGQAAADDELAQVKLANALRQGANATDKQIASVEDWIAAQGKALGITDDELRPAFARLAAATGDVESAQRQLSLAMDIAAGTGQSLDTVTKAMQKGINGSVGGLGRLGAVTKDAAGETMRYEDVLAQLAGKHMNAASKAADTTAGKQKILQVQFQELQEEIGLRLQPALIKLTSAGMKVVDWIGQNQTTVGVLVGTLGGLLAITWATTKAIAAWTAITKIAAAAQIVFTNVQWALNLAMTANPIGLVVLGIVALVAILVVAYKKSDTFRAIVNAAFGAVSAAAQALWGWIKTAFTAIVNKWNQAKAVAAALAVAVVLKFQSIVTWVKGLPGKIKNALSTLTTTVRNVFDNAMTAGKNKVENIGATIVGWITGIPGKLSAPKIIGDFKDAGKALIGAVVDGMKNAAGVISGIAGNVWTAVKSMLNAAIDKINAALEFTINLPGPDITVNPPNIPHLAKGGIVRKPTLALIGEDGPEAVVPLGKKNRPRGAMPGMGGGGLTVIVNTGVGDPVAIGREIEKVLLRYTQSTGRPLAFSTT